MKYAEPAPDRTETLALVLLLAGVGFAVLSFKTHWQVAAILGGGLFIVLGTLVLPNIRGFSHALLVSKQPRSKLPAWVDETLYRSRGVMAIIFGGVVIVAGFVVR